MKRRMVCSLLTRLILAVLAVAMAASTEAFGAKPSPTPTFPPMPIDYVISWLDPPPGGYNSWAVSLNSSGMAVGYYYDATGSERACLWTAEGAIDLTNAAPVPAGWILVTARAVNEFGQIAGSARNQATGQIRIYRYDPPTDTTGSQITFMGDPTNVVRFSISYNRPLNNLGDVSFSAEMQDGSYRAIVQAMDGTVFQRAGNGFNSISDSRQLIGGCIRWNASTGVVETFSSSLRGFDINASGYFSGQSVSGRSNLAMRFIGQVQNIGPKSSTAYGINSYSDVAGYVANNGSGFIYTDEYGFVDLDALVTAENTADLAAWASASSIQPYKLTDRSVSGFSEICGTAFFDGDVQRGFVLTPVPAP